MFDDGERESAEHAARSKAPTATSAVEIASRRPTSVRAFDSVTFITAETMTRCQVLADRAGQLGTAAAAKIRVSSFAIVAVYMYRIPLVKGQLTAG
jgi:hypothetical protein